MRLLRRDPSIPLGLAALAVVASVLQRPGLRVAETKVDLHVSPGSFLHDVLSAWTPQTSLGHVFAGQYGGYLWPMGPWFAAGDALGIPAWLVDRLWIALLLALSAWGMVRLLDELIGRPRGLAHLAGGLLYMLNPYVVTYMGRTSIALLATAALPWMLLCVHRGLREPRSLWWPALFALVLTSTGGGVNVAVTAWMLLGPALLALYEVLYGGIAARAMGTLAVRLVPIAAIASLWWMAAVVVHGGYGLDFLPFTEQPGTIWGTNSMSESLRLLGFWTSYIGVGYTGTLRSFQSDAGVYLGFAPVVLATLLIPALTLGSFAFTRRARYAPLFLALVLLGLLVMFTGFPEGTPLRHAATFTYNHVQPVRFLRTTYKAGPLVAVGLSGLAALAIAALAGRARLAATGGLAVLIAVACWPVLRGVALDRQLGVKHVPAAWSGVAHDLDRTLAQGQRAMVLPGQLFAYYRWGGTYDPVLPALTDRPVAVRFIVPFADLRSVDLQWTTDALISQQRALPGQLRPLLDLMGVGAVVQGADDDRSRSGAAPPAAAAPLLEQALGRPVRAYGPVRTHAGAAGTLEAARRLPDVRRWAIPTGGIVRVLPRAGPTVVDGSAQAIVDLAGFGALRTDRALRYAADLDPRAMRAAAASGGSFVISDSNRRRVFVAARLRGNIGWTIPAGEGFSQDAAVLNPFAARGPDAQTVQVLTGVRDVTAAFSPGFAQYPERQPFAAIDGDPSTAWIADRSLARPRNHLDVTFTAPRDVDHIDLLPYGDSRGVVNRVAVGGREFDVRPGWNRLALGLHHVTGLSVRLVKVTQAKRGEGGAGGISELRIPGVHATEALRPPVLVERALHGADLTRASVTYLFDRTTGDDPARPRVVTGDRQRGLVRDQQDGERAWARDIDPPAARAWRADARVGVAPETPDHVLDAWTGARGPAAFDGSSRFEGLGRNRASSAFDGDPRRAWIAGWIRARGAWLQWRTPRARAIRALRLVRPAVRARFPTRVRVIADGAAQPPVAVGADGTIPLASPLRARTVRIAVLDAAFAPGTPPQARQRRAVGVGEVTGAGVPRARVPRRGPLRVGCAAGPRVALGGRVVPMRVAGSIEELDAGRPLRAVGCGAPQALPGGPTTVRAPAAPWRVDHLRLTSPAAQPVAVAPAGRVLDQGRDGRGARDGVRVAVTRPGWLVLGESYDRGWRATCDGHDLGAPVPLQGFANGWPVPAGCSRVRFAFAPNRVLLGADAVSLVACLLVLGVLLVRRPRATETLHADLPDAAPVAWPLRRALAAGAAAAVVLGFVFALRAGIVLGPLVALALYRGVGARALALAGGAILLVAVPVLHLLGGLPGMGYDTNYAVAHIAAHWAAVLAVCALGMAMVLTLRPARVPGRRSRRAR
ncbi:MAG: alpha-(1-_3)-arabinofuranosyltransferase domain-containing protein [Solirubrobacteraceae bacterium]